LSWYVFPFFPWINKLAYFESVYSKDNNCNASLFFLLILFTPVLPLVRVKKKYGSCTIFILSLTRSNTSSLVYPIHIANFILLIILLLFSSTSNATIFFSWCHLCSNRRQLTILGVSNGHETTPVLMSVTTPFLYKYPDCSQISWNANCHKIPFVPLGSFTLLRIPSSSCIELPSKAMFFPNIFLLKAANEVPSCAVCTGIAHIFPLIFTVSHILSWNALCSFFPSADFR